MLSAVEEGLIKVVARGQSNAPIVSTLGLDETVVLQDGIARVFPKELGLKSPVEQGSLR